jgi:hypothetical protein
MQKVEEAQFFMFLETKNPALRLLAKLILFDSVRTTSEFAVTFNLSIREVESLKTTLRRAIKEYLEVRGDLAAQ